ncbi:MAG: arylesterase [Rhodospirillales bacterium]
MRPICKAILAVLVVFCLNGFASARAETARLLVLGDSLTAGYGLERASGFTRQLEAALVARGFDINVINAGVSGDTTAGGLSRVDWALTELQGAEKSLVLVELGANDGMRGFDPAVTEANLRAIIARIQAKGHPVLLAGMLAFPNLGAEYGTEFNAVFETLAREMDVTFYPFFLDGVAAEADLNQDDGIHPNAQGVAVIVKRILPTVLEALGQGG